ncbi:Protein kintoun [Merluccius polli]|uniref:Protein kintoun n=1 Tax=Merluccius polli TaxID=89951 RepID=A0AA47NV88_MERPO|nr:Protein kintoun [Merluccius polli]
MEVGNKLKELNMTADEVDRFATAFKDEKFRGLLLDYAKELSDPENKKRYEEEIKLLEGERGNAVDFIHPQPYKALKTSVNGKQKCFVNICTNDKVGKPEFKWGVSEDGRRGQHWSLPHSLHPGRPERDPKGNKFMIYDVIFHPDTIHMASRNTGFMAMVDSTALQGIQDGFKVRLDQNNVKVLSAKYKGTPQPCVIRKPIPGFKAEDPPAHPDPLAFPYPDETPPSTDARRPTVGPNPKEDPKPRSFTTEPPKKAGEPTVPNYTLKYRSFIDLQDFRCSRDSAQSPRPKEVVVTVDMPLLRSAKDTNLEVLGKSLLLESKKPAYRLEVPLAYPVDEENGEAKFNTQSGQLTVVLPVPPLIQLLEFGAGGGQTFCENETEEEGESDMEGEGKLEEPLQEDEEGDGKESKLKSKEAEENREVQSRTSEMNEQEELEKGKEEQESKCTQGITERGDGREMESIEARKDGVCDTEAQAENPRREDVPTTPVAVSSDPSTEENHSEPAHNRNRVPPYTQHQQTSTVKDEDSLKELEDSVGEEPGSSEMGSNSRNSIGNTEANKDTGTPARNEHLNGTSSTEVRNDQQ